ncbi:MAG: branched-chain amino acid ABC transporter permease [Actinomycetota bacterium]|nr:branched-chain amino acid ABC transporter permease [Acidimicrobiia bacterium]MDQ3601916.1 branched-chain amino acid ABC transporter permease [Actinomycetota bacterium]
MIKFLQLLFQGVSLGMIYSLIALGFVIVFKGTGVFNFAHGEFVMAAAYIVVAITATQPYGLAVLGALAVLVVIAMVVERFVLRKMIGEPLFAIVMVTLGISIMVRAVVTMIWGYSDKGFADPIGPGVWQPLDGLALAKTGVWTIGVSVALLVALWFFYQRTPAGLALRATAAHQEAAMAQGIDVRRMFAMSWAIAGLLATAGGIFLGAFPRQVGLTMGFVALNALPAIIIGGFDSLQGAVAGGVTVGVIQVMSSGYLSDYGGGRLQDVMPYVVMLLVLLVRPYGIWGSREIERV